MLMERIIFLQSALENLNGKSYYTFDDKNPSCCNTIAVLSPVINCNFLLPPLFSHHRILFYPTYYTEKSLVHSLMYEPYVYLYFIGHIVH